MVIWVNATEKVACEHNAAIAKDCSATHHQKLFHICTDMYLPFWWRHARCCTGSCLKTRKTQN
jgi:hypothetical protein